MTPMTPNLPLYYIYYSSFFTIRVRLGVIGVIGVRAKPTGTLPAAGTKIPRTGCCPMSNGFWVGYVSIRLSWIGFAWYLTGQKRYV
jgi:hypothetical protein